MHPDLVLDNHVYRVEGISSELGFLSSRFRLTDLQTKLTPVPTPRYYLDTHTTIARYPSTPSLILPDHPLHLDALR